jgi:crossover junction endodeoxyribonuclease RusA
MYRTFRGRQVISTEGRAFKAQAAWLATSIGLRPLAGKVAVTMTLHPKRPKRATGKDARCIDVDNALKAALDALNGIAFEDDSQVVDLHITRGEPVADGALVVTVGAA